MSIPAPEPGLVISYAYLWDYEAQSGREEGRKDRPCVIALAVQRQQDGETLVTVLPVTHRLPDDVSAAVEFPAPSNDSLALMMTGHGSLSAKAIDSSGRVMIYERRAAVTAMTMDFCRPTSLHLFSLPSGHGTKHTKSR